MAVILFAMMGVMCGMRKSKMKVRDQNSDDEGKQNVTRIYVHDARGTMNNNAEEYGHKNDESAQNCIPERNSPEMVQVNNIDNSLPPPPSESFLQSINLN